MRIGDQIHNSNKKTTPVKSKGAKKQIEMIATLSVSSSKGQIIASKVTDKQTFYLLKTDPNINPKWEEREKLLSTHKQIIEKYERQQKAFITSQQQQVNNASNNENRNSDESDEDKNKLNIKRKLFIGGKAPLINSASKKSCDETTKDGNQKSQNSKIKSEDNLDRQDQFGVEDRNCNNEQQSLFSFQDKKNNQKSINNLFEQPFDEICHNNDDEDISDINNFHLQDNQNQLFQENNSCPSNTRINPKNINKINEKQEQKNNQMQVQLFNISENKKQIKEIENIRYFNSSESEDQQRKILRNKKILQNFYTNNKNLSPQLNKQPQNINKISVYFKRDQLNQAKQQHIKNSFNEPGDLTEDIQRNIELGKEYIQTNQNLNQQSTLLNQENSQFSKNQETTNKKSNNYQKKKKSSSSEEDEKVTQNISRMLKKVSENQSQINKCNLNQTSKPQNNSEIKTNQNNRKYDMDIEENENQMVEENKKNDASELKNIDFGQYLQNTFGFDKQKYSSKLNNSSLKSSSIRNSEKNKLDSIQNEKINQQQSDQNEVALTPKKISNESDIKIKQLQQSQNNEKQHQTKGFSVDNDNTQFEKSISKIQNNHVENNTSQLFYNNETKPNPQQKEEDNQNQQDETNDINQRKMQIEEQQQPQKTINNNNIEIKQPFHDRQQYEQQKNYQINKGDSGFKHNDDQFNSPKCMQNYNPEKFITPTQNKQNYLTTQNHLHEQSILQIPDQGHFIYGDKAKRIIQCKPKKNEIEMEIEWEVRPNGKVPEKSILNSTILRKYDHNLLLDFYESKIKFTYKNADKKSQSLNTSIKNEYNSSNQE